MTAISAASAPELVTLRSVKQAAQVYAAIINPPIIFAAQVNGTPADLDMLVSITFDNVTTGAYTDIGADMLVWIGSSAGRYDIGQARARSATSTVLTIAEESELNIQDGYYISVLPDFQIWAKHIYVTPAGVAYMDKDVAYSDQHTDFTPLVVMGCDAVAEITGPSVATNWSAADSWVSGSTIASYAWTAPGGSIDDATSATPVITYTTPGSYIVTCTVTATTTGKTATGYRWAYIYAKRDCYDTPVATVSRARASDVATLVTATHGLSNGDVIKIHSLADNTYNLENVVVTVVNGTTFTYPCPGDDETTVADAAGLVYLRTAEAALPTKVQECSISLDYQRGGMEANVKLYDGADTDEIRDRARVILFAEDWYDGTRTSVGQIPGRENILAVGWISAENIQADINGGYADFVISGPNYWMDAEQSFPLGIENAQTTPAAWTSIQDLTIDKALASFMVWRTTASLCCDIYPNLDTRYSPAVISQTASLWAQLTEISERQILAHPCSDQFGRVFDEVDAQYLPYADRSGIPVVMSILSSEIMGPVDIERVIVSQVSQVDMSGISVSSDGIANTYRSLSPGHVFKRYGDPEPLDRLLLASQSQSNSLSGLILGQRNNQYPRISFELSENNRMIGICPRQYVDLDIPTTSNPRSIAYDGNALPRSVSWSYSRGSLTVSLQLEAETFEDLSTNGDIPTGDPDIPDIVLPPLPPLPPVPPLPPTPPPPTPTPVPMMALLFPAGYGLYYVNYEDNTWFWRSANDGFTPAIKASLNMLDVAPDGTMYVGTTLDYPDKRVVYSIPYGATYGSTVVAEGDFYSGLPNTEAPYYTEYALSGLAVDHITGIWRVLANRNFAAQAKSAMSYNGSISSFGDRNVLPPNYGFFQQANPVRFWGGYIYVFGPVEYQLPDRYFPLANRMTRMEADGNLASWIFNGDSFSSPFFFSQRMAIARTSGDIYAWDLGTTGFIHLDKDLNEVFATTGVDGEIDCDPTGQYLLWTKTDKLYYSDDYGENFTDVTASLSAAEVKFPRILNLGTELKWAIAYRDSSVMRIKYTDDAGATWTDIANNLAALLGIPDGVPSHMARA